MTAFDEVDPAAVRSGRGDWSTPERLETLSRYPMDCLGTEFPHFVGAVEDPEAIERPKRRHPVFYGCFDWHSAVHSHWCLVRQLRLFDDHPREAELVRCIDGRFTAENVDGEVEYLEANPSFEKPYGWAWFLRLASELHLWDDARADDWQTVLRPLEERIVDRVRDGLLPQTRPFRVGTHRNSAFALGQVLDYARVTSADALEAATIDRSREFFADDRNAPVEYEPMGWDFLSPSLVEADLMRRVLDPDEFATWLDAFLPDVTTAPYDTILDPIEVEPAPDDGIELHLVGLNLSKAWCLAGIASALDGGRDATAFERSAERHAERGLDRAFTDDYAGAHWLSSFVLYALTGNAGGIAPAGTTR